MSYLMGIDVGTTGTKTLLCNEEGEILARSVEEYPLSTPQPNWAEQDPEDWWKATVTSIRKVIKDAGIDPQDIKGLGLSGQMHGAVVIDKDYKVLRPCILWCDQRTADQCHYITEKIGRERLIELVSNPALTGFTAPKIVWIKENEPQIYEKAHKILLPKDYIRFRLTGNFATEVSDASGTLLFDVRNRKWSQEMLDELEISRDLMPQCYESPEVSGEISQGAAALTGLSPGTPVVGGGGDQAAGAVGNGVVEPGIISSTLGTSGVVFAFSEQVKVDPRLRAHTFCHAVPGKWHLMGVMLSAGGSLRWFRDTLGQEEVKRAREKGVDPYKILTEEAEKAPAGAEGLIFLPYLTGERTPHADPDAKGVFFGLTIRHRKSHLIRAVMEGVAYGLRDSLEILKELKIEIKQVRASGGGAKSPLWRQIQADINGVEMVTINVDEGPAFGVALLAGVGAGLYKNVEEAAQRTIRVTNTTSPDSPKVKLYDKHYQLYRSLYPILKDKFRQVSDLVITS